MSQTRWMHHTVTPEEAGRTVQDLLTTEMGVSRRMIQKLTRGRGVTLNRRPAQLSREVREGDVIGVRLAREEESGLTPVEMELRIVHEDADLLVLDKPPFILVHPVAPHHTRTLVHGVAHHLRERGEQRKVRPIHRLDRDTSGLILIAKTAFVHQHLDRQLRERTLRREYLALAAGRVEPDSGEIDAPIARRHGAPHLREVSPAGERALTRFRVVERLAGASLLELELETGRTHQIRVHLAHLGHPLFGDDQYGGPPVAGLRRQALHASRLSFTHPSTGSRLELESPLPPDIQAVRDRFAPPDPTG